MADQWEYMSLTMKWDIAAKQWKMVSASSEEVRGTDFGAALNPEGEQGWEVVNFTPNSGWSRTEVVDNVRYPVGFGIMSYLVLFKRRKP